MDPMDALWLDSKHSARMLRRSPGFTLAAVGALALGIATNAAIFPVIDAVLLKPFAYPDAGRIVMLQSTFRQGGRTGSASPTEFNWWRQHNDGFECVSAYDFSVANFTGEFTPEQIPTMHVSADFLRLSGADVLWGRAFAAADDVPNAPKTVVLTWWFWQRRFGADPGVIGRRITLGGERYEIIGVVGPKEKGGQLAEQSLGSGDLEIEEPPDVYLPFQLDPNSTSHGHSFNVAARLKPGVTLAAANARLQAGFPEYARQWPGDAPEGMGFAAQALHDAVVGGVRTPLLILLGAVGCVLLIACANVANLLLARGAGRRREIAIRAAVGAHRGRIVRQLLTESVMLALPAGAIGLAAGYAGIRAVLHLSAGNIPRIGAGGLHVVMDWRVVGFTFVLAIVTSIVFGLVPALDASRADLIGALKEGAHRGGTGLRQNRMRGLLAAMEMAMTLVLLIGAALLLRSFAAIRRVDPGFNPHHVLTARMSLTGLGVDTPERAAQVLREGVRRIRELPGVESVATTCCVPLEDRLRQSFRIGGRPDDTGLRNVAGWTGVSAAYFETFRIPIVRGRGFTEQDESGPPAVVINQAMARRFWPDGDPLLDQISIGNGPPRRIVGVAGDVRDDALNRSPRPNIYELSAGSGMLKQVPWVWAVRTRVPPMQLKAAIEKELVRASGGLPVARIGTMEESVARSTAGESFRTLVLTVFGGAALLLASIGIYGLMAYSVAQRVAEIGIRLALGADSRRIRKMVVWQGLRPALAGLIAGLAAAFALTRAMAGLLFGVTAWDPLVFCGVPALLTIVALAAVWMPAMRASRVDPAVALRSE